MIVWTITEQQADQVLNALSHRPFLEVSGLIQLLLKQAQQQAPQQPQTGGLESIGGYIGQEQSATAAPLSNGALPS
jgi:hypothetical protein